MVRIISAHLFRRIAEVGHSLANRLNHFTAFGDRAYGLRSVLAGLMEAVGILLDHGGHSLHSGQGLFQAGGLLRVSLSQRGGGAGDLGGNAFNLAGTIGKFLHDPGQVIGQAPNGQPG